MRIVLIAGAALAVAFLVVSRALALLNEPSDLSVTAGYFLLVTLAAAATGLASWFGRRR